MADHSQMVNPLKSSFARAKRPTALKLSTCIQHLELMPFNVYSNDPALTLTKFMAHSTVIHYAFIANTRNIFALFKVANVQLSS